VTASPSFACRLPRMDGAPTHLPRHTTVIERRAVVGREFLMYLQPLMLFSFTVNLPNWLVSANTLVGILIGLIIGLLLGRISR
jgi:hypothetical protein